MWNAISNMIIKAADNMNRGVENAGKAGDGNNGVDYSNVDTGGEGGGSGSGSVGGYQQPEGQNTSGVESTTSAVKGIANMAKDAIANVGSKSGDTGGKEEKKPTDNIGSKGEDTDGEEEKKPTDNIGGGAISAPTTSDERLKRIFGDNADAIEAFAKLDSIQFTYNDKAKEVHPNEENGVDNDLHYGIKAQDLEKNPFTAAVVSKDPEGFKQIDPAELTAANTGVIAEICKRLLIIEKVLGIKVV